MNPITIDLSGLKNKLGLDDTVVDQLTETCVNAVTSAIYSRWEALAKKELQSTLPEYLQNLIHVDKGRFTKQIVLTGVLPNMLEQGASPFDIKAGFRKSSKRRFTIPKYDKNGMMLRKGGEWYLTIPFRIGVPGTLGQAGFTGQMSSEVYDVMRKRSNRIQLRLDEIPSPSNARRMPIQATATTPYYPAYTHKNSIYEGLMKRRAQYGKVAQNTYGTFRRVSENSDPMSWIHKGIKAYAFAEEAVRNVDVDTIVENEVTTLLEEVL